MSHELIQLEQILQRLVILISTRFAWLVLLEVYREKSLLHQVFGRLRALEVPSFASSTASEPGEAWRRLYSAGVSAFAPPFHIPLRAALDRH